METSTTSLEFVQNILTDRAARRKIFAGAREEYGDISAATHRLVAVESPDSVWEVGIVPKNVEYNAGEFSTSEMILCKDGLPAFRPRQICKMTESHWQLLPQ